MGPEVTPAVRVIERRQDYRVTGSTAGHLRDVIALLGPNREGRTFMACTDWAIRWTYPRVECAGGFRPGPVAVEVEICIVMPCWRPPPGASASLIATWEAALSTLAAHEQGHRALAIEAGDAIQRALGELPAQPTAPALDEAASARAGAILDEYRERERAYDQATEHGQLPSALRAH